MSSSFRKAPYTYQQKVRKNAMLRQVVPSIDKSCQEDFPEAFF